MLSLADIVRLHGPAYMQRFGAALLPSHADAIDAVRACRTPAMGGHLAECTTCGGKHIIFHSCQHRACPRCDFAATELWLARQRALLLPVPYFHVVFTLPAELRRVVRSHQTALLPILFRAAFDTLSELCADSHYLGGRIGALAVLHTWTRTLEFHPHLHMLVPGGALAPDGQTWLTPSKRRQLFLVPVRALAKRFAGRFLSLANKALPGVLPPLPKGKRWVVYAKPTAQGADKVLDYLGRYVHRTALSDKALVDCDDQSVRFTYRRLADGQHVAMTLHPHEFLRRFLQHVLPPGLHRVRTFGLLHPAHRATLQRLQLQLGATPPGAEPESTPAASSTQPRCMRCGTPTLQQLRPLTQRELDTLQRYNQAYLATYGAARAPPLFGVVDIQAVKL